MCLNNGGFEIANFKPPFSFSKNENTGGVLKSPFFKDTAVSGRYRRVHFYLLYTDAPAVYQNVPTFAYAIGEYRVDKEGMLTGPADETLVTALQAKGFMAE